MGPPDTQGYSFNAYYFFKKISIYNHIHVSVLKNKKYHLRLFTTSPRPFSRWTEQPKNQSTGRPILVLPLGHSVSLKPSLNLNPTHERSTGSSRGQRRRVPAGSGYAGVGGGLAGGFGLAQEVLESEVSCAETRAGQPAVAQQCGPRDCLPT